MFFFALLLLLQSAAAPPAAQSAQGDPAETAPATLESAPESGGLRGPSGKRDGRRGNDLYRQEAYADAAAAYAGGIAILSDDAPPRVRYGLRNNLGAALLKSGNAESARETFDQAMAEAREAGEEMDLARSAYNAGNAAFAAEDLEGALAYYRRSLLRNPGNEDARFNYEFVKRRIEEQERQQQEPQNQDRQESGGENSENDQNEPRQDENEENAPQNEQQEQDEQNQQQEQSGESEPQPDASPQEQAQNPQRGAQPLSEAQAERILQALEQEEGDLLRELQRTPTRPHRVEKDW